MTIGRRVAERLEGEEWWEDYREKEEWWED